MMLSSRLDQHLFVFPCGRPVSPAASVEQPLPLFSKLFDHLFKDLFLDLGSFSWSALCVYATVKYGLLPCRSVGIFEIRSMGPPCPSSRLSGCCVVLEILIEFRREFFIFAKTTLLRF